MEAQRYRCRGDGDTDTGRILICKHRCSNGNRLDIQIQGRHSCVHAIEDTDGDSVNTRNIHIGEDTDGDSVYTPSIHISGL